MYATLEASAQILELSPRQNAKDALDILSTLSILSRVPLPLAFFEGAWKGARKANALGDDDDFHTFIRWHTETSLLPPFIQAESKDWDPYRVVEAIRLLASLSLIAEHKLGNSTEVPMHPLAHRWARVRQSTLAQKQAWLTTGAVIALASDCRHPVWYLHQELTQLHIHSWLEQKDNCLLSGKYQREIAQMMVIVGWQLCRMGQMRHSRVCLRTYSQPAILTH